MRDLMRQSQLPELSLLLELSRYRSVCSIIDAIQASVRGGLGLAIGVGPLSIRLVSVLGWLIRFRHWFRLARGRGQMRGGNGGGRGQRAPGRGVFQTLARQLALVYAVRRREDWDAANMIAGTFGFVFSANLMELPFQDFNLILGTDWLAKHRVGLYCEHKRVTFKVGDGEEVVMVGKCREYLSNVISTLAVEKLVCNGCDAYLAYVYGMRIVGSTVEGIRTIKDFPGVVH
ncbi:hypothetical protein EPI10_005334 [Gossypium australe]|uniref:Uncharacterized protein n=1 Tax=Gossypium australe TaxID=47621 RepID=A0A5B6WMQ8_9ROSI|nr:hypothetical protein EPI10_005334 [Gossypium australe]